MQHEQIAFKYNDMDLVPFSLDGNSGDGGVGGVGGQQNALLFRISCLLLCGRATTAAKRDQRNISAVLD